MNMMSNDQPLLSRDELEQWTQAKRRWHARKFPSNWADIERRLVQAERALGLRVEPVIDWNAIRPKRGQEEPRITDPKPEWDFGRGTADPEPETTPCRVIHTIDIIRACAAFGRVPVDQVLGPRRQRLIVRARQAAMYLADKHCGRLSLVQVGKKFGGRDHTTVMHARDKVQADLDAGGAVFGEIVEHVERELGMR